MASRNISRLALGMALRLPCRRKIHTEVIPPLSNISEIFSGMLSSGPHPSIDRINKSMNAIYMHRPRAVTLLNVLHRTPADRSTLRVLKIGAATKQNRPQKNIVLVSGLPLQHPSTIGVNLYVAAMLSHNPTGFPYDVSIIPLAHPRDYEKRWEKMELASSSLFSPSGPAPLSVAPIDAPPQWMSHEGVSLDLGDTCKPIEAYITRQNKYFVNIDVNMSAYGSSMQHKKSSLAATTGKYKNLFTPNPTPSPLPSSPFPSSPFTSTPNIYGPDSLLSPFINAPALVLELRSSQALDDDQVAARGEEVIEMLKGLM